MRLPADPEMIDEAEDDDPLSRGLRGAQLSAASQRAPLPAATRDGGYLKRAVALAPQPGRLEETIGKRGEAVRRRIMAPRRGVRPGG